ncbi:MAG: PA domain-containing protein, partial [Anaerolineae bacterium]
MKRRSLLPLTAVAVVAVVFVLASSATAAWMPESLVAAVSPAVGPDRDAPSRTQQQVMLPGDAAPRITLPTLDGEVSFGGQPDDESYVLLGFAKLSSFSTAVWSASASRLIRYSPDDVNYVFMSYGDTQEEVDADIAGIKSKVDDAIGNLIDEDDQQHWRDHMHYVPVNPLTLDQPTFDFLMAWGARLAQVDAEWVGQDGATVTVNEYGTTDNGWAKSLSETGPITRTLAWYGGLACGDETPEQDPTDKIALIERGTCAFSEKLANAEKHGAVAGLLFTDADRGKSTMSAECGDNCPDIPIAMIDRDPGLRMVEQLDAGNTVTATLTGLTFGVEAMGVNQLGRVREFGSIPFPFNEYLTTPVDNFQLIAYEAEHMSYEHQRDSRLAAEEAAGTVTVVPVLEGEWGEDPDWAGVRSQADVELPDAATMATFDKLELDLSLACEDNRKANCPAWDYLVHLYLCDEGEQDGCGIEVGRWITAYWSGGRWVTDVTPMLGYLSDGGTRRFEFYTQQRYQIDLSLRLSRSDEGEAVAGKRAFDLGWTGGPFWDDYNSRFYPIEFEVPEWAEKVELMSYVTGHGFGKDKENCAEFCNHT